MRRWGLLGVSVVLGIACRSRTEPAPAPVPTPAATATAIAKPAVKKPKGVMVPIRPLAADVREGSAIALATIGNHTVAFVADADESTVHTLDLAAGREIATTFVAGKPERLLVVGGRLAVALRDRARVDLLGASAADAALEEDETLATADEPIALARTPDGKQLWVASGWGRTLEGFAVDDGRLFARIPLAREPRAVSVAADGRRAFVGYMTEGEIDVVGLESRTVSAQPLDGVSFAMLGEMPAFRPVSFRQTFALVRVPLAGGEAIVVPHVRVTTGDPNGATTGYGAPTGEVSPVVFDLTALDSKTMKGAHTPPIARVDDCRLPRDAAALTGARVAIACLGSDHVNTYDVSGPTRNMTASVKIPGGPHALAHNPRDNSLVVATLFDRQVWLMPPNGKPKSIALSHVEGRGLPGHLAEGRKLFHRATDTRISGDGRACASCHPDGRDDGLVWPTPDGPRKTMFLAGRLARGKNFGWEAKHSTIPVHLEATTKNLKGTGVSAADAEKLAAYCLSMAPPPRTPRELTAEEAHGREIFRVSAGCAGCHAEDSHFTDAASHDVQSGLPNDKTKAFLAPSLKYLAGTARYFHDGRYTNLAALITGSDGKMGATGHLSKADVRDLAAYLETL